MNRMAALSIKLWLGVAFGSALAASGAQEPKDQPVPTGVTLLAMQSLRRIEETLSFHSVKSSSPSFVFVGNSRGSFGGWRVVAVRDTDKSRVVWDSYALNDPYFAVIGLASIEIQREGTDGYTVALRGCVPHECADGKIGFAIYSSESNKTYVAHILTRSDGSYQVTYRPNLGMPERYREQLDQKICSDTGISNASKLPVKCFSKR